MESSWDRIPVMVTVSGKGGGHDHINIYIYIYIYTCIYIYTSSIEVLMYIRYVYVYNVLCRFDNTVPIRVAPCSNFSGLNYLKSRKNNISFLF